MAGDKGKGEKLKLLLLEEVAVQDVRNQLCTPQPRSGAAGGAHTTEVLSCGSVLSQELLLFLLWAHSSSAALSDTHPTSDLHLTDPGVGGLFFLRSSLSFV